MKIAKRLKHRFMWRINCKWTFALDDLMYFVPTNVDFWSNQIREEIDKEVLNSFKTA